MICNFTRFVLEPFTWFVLKPFTWKVYEVKSIATQINHQKVERNLHHWQQNFFYFISSHIDFSKSEKTQKIDYWKAGKEFFFFLYFMMKAFSCYFNENSFSTFWDSERFESLIELKPIDFVSSSYICWGFVWRMMMERSESTRALWKNGAWTLNFWFCCEGFSVNFPGDWNSIHRIWIPRNLLDTLVKVIKLPTAWNFCLLIQYLQYRVLISSVYSSLSKHESLSHISPSCF